MVGAMSPSSRFLAKKMLEPIDFSKDKIIVELGPGTGVFTRKILEQLAPDAKLLVFELNDHFVTQLKKEFKDERVVLIHDTAEKLADYLKEMGVSKADVIVSSLPLANFPDDLRNRLLRTIQENMGHDSRYIQFQYSLLYKQTIKQLFKHVNISFTPMNFPPAFVYACKK